MNIRTFLEAAVQPHRRDRYLGYLTGSKGLSKFLAALDHDLARDIISDKVGAKLTSKELMMPGVLYSSKGDFEVQYSSVKEAYDAADWYGGWLIVGGDGNYAIYRPEGKSDNEMVIRL